MKLNGTTVPTGRDNTYSNKETKKDIQTGRAVYADKDKYESDSAYKTDIDKYVKEGFHLIFGTPDNPSEGGSSGGGDGGTAGYECTETKTTLTEETVTTTAGDGYNVGVLSYSQEINADTIVVTFDGTEYECPLVDLQGDNGYGGWNASTGEPDFSNYPFALITGSTLTGYETALMTATAGTYQIKIETVEKSVETSECFKKAVKSVIPASSVLQLIPGVTTEAEVEQANANGTLMYVQGGNDPSSKVYAFVQSYFNGHFSTIPDATTLGRLIEIQNGVVALGLSQ